MATLRIYVYMRIDAKNVPWYAWPGTSRNLAIMLVFIQTQ